MREQFHRSLASIIKRKSPETARRIAAELEVDRDFRRRMAKGEKFQFIYRNHEDANDINHDIEVSWSNVSENLLDGHFLLDGRSVDPAENPDDWKTIQQAMKDIRERRIQINISFLK
jgi:hypothetical protein